MPKSLEKTVTRQTQGGSSSGSSTPTSPSSGVSRTNHHEKHYPFACVSCRKHHKKCDKLLPICSRCKLKGWKCQYEMIERKKDHPATKKKKEINNVPNNNHPINNNNTNNLHEMTNHHLKNGMPSTNLPLNSNLINISEQTMLHSFSEDPMITPRSNSEPVHSLTFQEENSLHDSNSLIFSHATNRKTLEVYINVIWMGIFPIKDPWIVFEKLLQMKPHELAIRKDILVYLLSIQCVCEQAFAFPELAERSVKKLKSVMMHIYDDFQNPFVNLANENLALYHACEGNRAASRGYLALAENFACSHSSKHVSKQLAVTTPTTTPGVFLSTSTTLVDFPKHGIQIYMSPLKMRLISIELMCCDSFPIPDIPTMAKLYPLITEMSVFENEGIQFLQHLNNRIDERFKGLHLLGMLVSTNVKPILTDFCSKLFDLQRAVFATAVQMLCQMIDVGLNETSIISEKLEAYQSIEYYAVKMSKILENPQSIFLNPYMSSFIIIAAKVNLEICKMIERGERQNLQPIPQPTLRNLEHFSQDASMTNEMEIPSGVLIDYYALLTQDFNKLKDLSKRCRYLNPYLVEFEQFLNNHRSITTCPQHVHSTMSQQQQQQQHSTMSQHQHSKIDPPQGYQESQFLKIQRMERFFTEMKSFLLRINERLDDTMKEHHFGHAGGTLVNAQLVTGQEQQEQQEQQQTSSHNEEIDLVQAHRAFEDFCYYFGLK
ncbi:hypothetical protein C9374_001523 [Naegleria lovaniensis]|uniref:Zn(2)-C6 fungal-type domain-containing protein n=1 Tax=Naegleria lovaniensis TaxID=51637 RepID=A0AA88KN48_NAELO|nr:uncharacterized protein C9374_001523 [Naegleria lovaniensis]KAG2387191.1 hypothetical protein C9374_001523 [Naegleria lovaniensis]